MIAGRRAAAEAIGTLVLAAVAVLGILTIAYKPGLPLLLTRQHGRLEAGPPRAGAQPQQLRRHDVVTHVGGIAVETPEAAELVLDGYAPGARVAIEVERDGRPELVTEQLGRWYGPFFIGSLAFTAALYFALGALVRQRRPRDPAALAFSGAAMSIAVMISTSWGSRVLPVPGLGALLMPVNGAAYALSAALSVTFVLLFPRPRIEWTRELGLALAGLAGLIAAWRGIAYVLFLHDPAHGIRPFLLAFDTGRVFLLAGVAAALAIFAYGAVRARSPDERRQLGIVLAGLSIAIPGFLLLWQIPTLLGRPGLVPEAAIQLLVSIIPITFAISMIYHHLMDIDVLVSRSGAYAIAAGAVLLVYLAIVAIAAAVAGERVHWSATGSAATAIVIALLFEPLRVRLQRLIDRVFFRARYDLRRAEDALAATVRDGLGPTPLAEAILAKLDELVPADGYAMVGTASGEHGAVVLARRGFALLEPALALHCATGDGVAAVPERVEPGVAVDDREPALRRAGATLGIALRGSAGRVLGVLLAGARRSGTRYTREDLDLLSFAAHEAGSALERFALQEEVLLQHAESVRLAELNRVHSLFVSGISHDMRTPLASIRMFAELLSARDGLPPATRREYIGVIEGEAARLERLIENVLEYARIERQAQVYRPERCELNGLVRETLRSLRYLFRVHRVTLRVALAKEPLPVFADPRAIAAALTNLATNAVKYSGSGRRVTVRVRRVNGDASIDVEDRGIGIAAADLPHVFEAFYRSSDRAVSEVGGAGLGLMVVRHAMEAHGGRASVTSCVGRGSTFTLQLPLSEEPADEPDPDRRG